MNTTELIEAIKSGKFDDSFRLLYGDAERPRVRYIDACRDFEKIFPGKGGLRLFSAPGRTEVGGNHTDHQHGRVLAGSVNLDVIAVVSANDSGLIRIKSKGYSMDEVYLDALNADDAERGRAAALIRGICARFDEKGFKIGGFDAYTTSDVLKGSGLSSSAAFEVLVGNVLNGLYNGGDIEAVELAKIGQYAEREYFGKPCGLLDQMASAVGGFTFADFHDPSDPVIEKIDFDLKSHGYLLCVVDTGGDHANLTQDYADITLECKKISNVLNVDYLRDADEKNFYASAARLRAICGDRALLRAFHFFNEDRRVEEQKKALKSGDFAGFLKLVRASGDSSYKYLQNLYSASDSSEQGLPIAIAFTEKFLDGDGACRVHGGGFAGTIQCYIPADRIADYKKMIEAVFGEGSCAVLDIRPVGGCEVKM